MLTQTAIFEIGMLADSVRIWRSNLRMLPNPTSDKWLGDESLIDWVVAMKAIQEQISAIEEGDRKSHPTLLLILDQWYEMKRVRLSDLDGYVRSHPSRPRPY